MSFAMRKERQSVSAVSPLPCRDEGAGQPIVLIHGWALDLEMWAPQVAAFTRGFRVIRMDRHGFGASRAAPSLVEDVKAIAELIERLDLQNVVLVGMSQGARVALALAECLPRRLVRLVLDGAPWESVEQLDTEPEVP